jgi:hypothetical protein
MNHMFLATLILVSSGAVATPAFASGYGPAPFYRPSVGAPGSQQGPSAQTIAAEQTAHGVGTNAFGSSCDAQAQSNSGVKATDASMTSSSLVSNRKRS